MKRATRPQQTPAPKGGHTPLQVPAGRRTPSRTNCKQKQVVSANVLFIFVLLGIAAIYALLVFLFYEAEVTPSSSSADANAVERRMKNMGLRRKGPVDVDQSQYPYWRDKAVELAKLPAEDLLKELNGKDPFGTRQFEKSLLDEETRLGRLLEPDEVKALFPCPSSRITLPDQRFLQKARDFRDNKPGTFLFFQHLRKAGGTHFCSLAKANLPKNNVAQYYCMPDMQWSGGKKAGYLHSWSNEHMIQHMRDEHMRIAGNEWDWFDREHHFELPAVFTTSFRKPLDRALSQFRFECVEDRGCKGWTIEKFWEKRLDLYNVYSQTFADTGQFFGKLDKAYRGKTSDLFPDAAKQRADMVGKALDTVAKFNLVLAMEFLAYAGPQVDKVLGFHDTSPLTKRVRPHINQAKRDDGQEQNSMGAAGITKASWDPEKYLSPEMFKKMSESLALDMILTDAARRMFLERLVCTDLDN